MAKTLGSGILYVTSRHEEEHRRREEEMLRQREQEELRRQQEGFKPNFMDTVSRTLYTN